MVIRKVVKMNSIGSIGITIPKDYTEKMSLDANCNVNIVLAGKTLHITKVIIQ